MARCDVHGSTPVQLEKRGSRGRSCCEMKADKPCDCREEFGKKKQNRKRLCSYSQGKANLVPAPGWALQFRIRTPRASPTLLDTHIHPQATVERRPDVLARFCTR